MSSDGGSARNTLASQCSTSSSGSTDSARRRREYWKKDRKIVRILTVLAYIVSVSTAAVLLSAYYVFLWNPKPRSPHAHGYGGSQDGGPRTLSLALGVEPQGSQGSSIIEIDRPLVTGRMAPSSFALSASQVDLKVGSKNINTHSDQDLNYYVKTNTKVYQQKQIPIPQSTVILPTTQMPTISAGTSRLVKISSTGWPIPIIASMEVVETATTPAMNPTNPP